MCKVKEILNVTKEGFTIKSTDLVDIINMFRKEEGGKTELKHSDFMKKIRKELEVLESLGLEGQGNFSSANYRDKQGKTRDCYELNRDGMLQMLNSESTYCRYKTIEYINELENALNNLTKKNYSLRMDNLTRLFLRVYPMEYESIAKEIIEYHTNLPKKLRMDKRHKKMDKTEYKQFVRDKLVQALGLIQEDIDNKDIVSIRLYAKELIIKLRNGQIETTNRSTAQLLSNRERELNRLNPSLEEMYCVKYHPFTWNSAIKNGRRTWAYNNWINNFPVDEVPDREMWEIDYGVNFNKPIKIFLRYINMSRFDMDNLSKSFIDRLFNEYRGVYHVDDSIVHALDEKTIGHCDNYEDGRVYFFLQNMSDEEIKNIKC